MKKLGKLLAVVMVVALLSGCETMRRTAIGISEEEVLNAETTRQVALNYLSIWPLHSGIIKGALGPRMDELPAQAVDAINELDQLAEQAGGDPNSYSDEDLGLSLGLRVRILVSVVGEALKLYAPDVLEFVPMLF